MAASTRPVVLIIVALVIGLLAALMAQRWLQGRLDESRAEAEAGITSVVVAAKDIRFAEKLSKDSLETAEWPVDSLPDGALRSVDEAKNLVASSAIYKGEPITSKRAVDTSRSSLLATRIAPNMRAVSVKVDEVRGVAGFLLPGSHVDVLATTKGGKGGKIVETKTVLQNVPVLAVDQRASPDGEDKPVVVDAVTLEVSPQDAEILVRSTREGKIQLALRNPQDTDVVQTPGSRSEEIADRPATGNQSMSRAEIDALTGAAPAPQPAPAKRKTRSTASGVAIIRGTHVESGN